MAFHASGDAHLRGMQVVAAPLAKRVASAAFDQATGTDWYRRLSWSIWCTDLVILVLAVFGAQLVWFSSFRTTVATWPGIGRPEITYLGVSAALVIGWMAALSLTDSRTARVLGVDATEYRRVADASLRIFGLIAIIALLVKIDLARGYLLISLPIGVCLLVLGRWMWRRWLIHQRRLGLYSRRVVLLGSSTSIEQVARDLQRFPGAGYLVVGACTSAQEASERGWMLADGQVRVLGDFDDIIDAMARVNADTVIVTGSDDLPAARVKELSWQLESGRQHLVLSPGIADVAGPRIHTRPVAGLPLVHVETPRLRRGQLLAKRGLDVSLATVGIIVLSPLLAALAVLVRTNDGGPAIFAQTRVGRDGRGFRMYKFRSMVPDAEERLAEVRDRAQDSGNEVLFKLRCDPRVTTVGRWMRRYSLDELPQLFNVLAGDMSLVGPRPPLRSEVEQYPESVHRRFLMKPGITGLWQVSGRSSLSWDTSVRLDLSYVENYSVVGDLVILGKTARAVLLPGEDAH